MSAAAAAVAEPVVGHPRKVVVVVQLELDEHLLALAIAQLADLDGHLLPVRCDDRIRPPGALSDAEPVCVSTIFMCSFMFTRPMDISPPRQPARQSRRSCQSLTNLYVPEMWLEMSQSDAGSCERP